jgi:hypothetical protein
VALPFSSDGPLRARFCAVAAVVGLAGAVGLAGCVTVRPQERELLADPAMTFGSDGQIQAHDEHVFSNREGSYGAGSVSGGGCGCN